MGLHTAVAPQVTDFRILFGQRFCIRAAYSVPSSLQSRRSHLSADCQYLIQHVSPRSVTSHQAMQGAHRGAPSIRLMKRVHKGCRGIQAAGKPLHMQASSSERCFLQRGNCGCLYTKMWYLWTPERWDRVQVECRQGLRVGRSGLVENDGADSALH